MNAKEALIESNRTADARKICRSCWEWGFSTPRAKGSKYCSKGCEKMQKRGGV